MQTTLFSRSRAEQQLSIRLQVKDHEFRPSDSLVEEEPTSASLIAWLGADQFGFVFFDL